VSERAESDTCNLKQTFVYCGDGHSVSEVGVKKGGGQGTFRFFGHTASEKATRIKTTSTAGKSRIGKILKLIRKLERNCTLGEKEKGNTVLRGGGGTLV